jgi:Dolichyl-phosphate-mannose-protein mannosyltransferase
VRYVRRFPFQALFCALALLVCELISLPFTNMTVCDDGLYIAMAETFARTGHIVYNGWAAGMMASQLYLGAAFIKLFGFSYTTVRMSTLLIAAVTAFAVQRTLVRTGISERNATIGTLALVLSPLYLMLSATFMTDISGLFAVVVCLYGCIRALQASTDRSTIAWLCFGVISNALCGTSRQIAWLGVFVMVPCTLWLLRSRRRVVLAGAAVSIAGALFILACMHWLKLQPYVYPVPLLVSNFPIRLVLAELRGFVLDIPFLVLPVAAVFLAEIRKSRPRSILVFSTVLLGYLLVAIHVAIRRPFYKLPQFNLEPTGGDWVGVNGIYGGIFLYGPPIFLHIKTQILLTVAALGGTLGVVAVIFQTRQALPSEVSATDLSWRQLSALMLPFSLAYTLILAAAAGTTSGIFDRYALGLLCPALIFLIRCYQERVQPSLPLATTLLVGVMAVYGIAITHNNFALDRARVALADELYAKGVPDTSIDGGWDYNFEVELRHSNHINNPAIKVPANAYVSVPQPPAGVCQMAAYDRTPHIHPVYGISFDPRACLGQAPFAPVTYSRWLAPSPGILYVVGYTTLTGW